MKDYNDINELTRPDPAKLCLRSSVHNAKHGGWQFRMDGTCRVDTTDVTTMTP